MPLGRVQFVVRGATPDGTTTIRITTLSTKLLRIMALDITALGIKTPRITIY